MITKTMRIIITNTQETTYKGSATQLHYYYFCKSNVPVIDLIVGSYGQNFKYMSF